MVHFKVSQNNWTVDKHGKTNVLWCTLWHGNSYIWHLFYFWENNRTTTMHFMVTLVKCTIKTKEENQRTTPDARSSCTHVQTNVFGDRIFFMTFWLLTLWCHWKVKGSGLDGSDPGGNEDCSVSHPINRAHKLTQPQRPEAATPSNLHTNCFWTGKHERGMNLRERDQSEEEKRRMGPRGQRCQINYSAAG